MRGGIQKWLILMTGIFGAFMSILDSTIVNTAIPKIQAIFGADLHQASYITTGYTLAAGVVVSSSGFLANRFGIKRIYLLSLLAFTLGSALCGLAWNIESLIVFRVLQGAGGAALFPLTFSLVFGAFPPEQRGLANGLFGIPVLFAPAIGPTLGGYLVEYTEWRWIFYVNVPIGIVGIILGVMFLKEGQIQRDLPFDLRGFLIIGTALGLLLFGVSNLSYDGWSSLFTVSGPTVVALFLILVFIPVELGTTRPLLDLRLYGHRNFLVGNLIIWIATVGLFGPAFLLPQYLQNLRGLDPYNAGLLLLPNGLAAMAGTILGGILYNRIGPKGLIMIGGIVAAITSLLIGQWSTLTSAFVALTPLLILRGVTLPFLMQNTNTVALQGVVGPALPGATTLMTVGRNVIASLAIAVLANILQTQRLLHQADMVRRITPGNATAMAAINRLTNQFMAGGLPQVQAHAMALGQVAGMVVRQATALAFQDVYWLTAMVTIPAIFMTLLLRPVRVASQATAAAAMD